jgi:23S rRNA pseudouridine1911/1915/1917 synthase
MQLNNQNLEKEDDGNDDLYEHFRFVADKGQQPLRVDKYLMNKVENATRNKIQKSAKDGNIRINDIAVKSNQKVRPNDVVTVLFEHPPYEYLLKPEDIPIDIVYEDDDVLVVNKQAGMVVHPGHGNYSGTLINALTFHFENLPNNSSDRPGLVHRIDKDTSGLLVVAKTEIAMTKLSKQFFNKTTEREYVALAWGNMDEDEGTIEGNIGRHPKNRLQNTVFYGEEAEEKGRTHQIRVHMKYIGHTLFNDERYGGERILKGTTFSKYKQFVENCFKVLPRQALHAHTLGFKHPVSGEMMRFEAPIPEDMELCLDKWRNYSRHVVE